MIIKKHLLIPLLCIVCHLNSYGHAIKKSSSECTGKVTQERLQLFVQAERHEQNLIAAQAQCLHDNDCDTNPAFKRAKNQVLYSITTLMDHLEELEEGKSDTCNACEKNETAEIKDRLMELLKSSK